MQTRAVAGVFVGRERDLDELASIVDAAATGRGSLVLVSGEAGIGKTRLAEETADVASARGFDIVRASCYEDEGTPAFWLWIQVLRAVVPSDETGAERVLGPHRADVAHLVPELGRAGEASVALDSSEARFRLLDALTRVVRAGAAERPLFLVLEDLHWADAASLEMVRFFAREIRDAPIVAIGTYRDTELAEGDLSGVIADLRRHASNIQLAGLVAEEVADLIAPWRTDAPRLVRTVTDETGGNPFFVKEVVRLLAAQGRLHDDVDLSAGSVLPQTVRDVIDHHLSRLSQGCHEMLEAGSALGQEFALPLLAEVMDVPADRLLAVIGEAVSARALIEVPSMPGTFRFAHALVREAVYEGLGTVRTLRIHHRIAMVLEHVYRHALDERIASITHHILRAVPLAKVDKAVSYAARASEIAARSGAYEQAVAHLADALRVLELAPPDPVRRCELLVALGDARWRSGDVEAARVTFLSAAEAARAAGASELMARAALGYGAGVGGQGFTFAADEKLIGLLEDALAALEIQMSEAHLKRGGSGGRSAPGPRDDLRARLMARLAVQYYWTGDLGRGRQMSLEAIALAETTGDPRIVLEALYSRLTETDLPLETERQRAEDLVVGVSSRGDLELEFWVQQYRMTILAELGDTAAVDVAIDTCARIADTLRMPRYRWQVTSWRLGRALMAADLDRAQRLCDESVALTQDFTSEGALFVHAAQLGVLRWEQGRFDELEPLIAALGEQYPWIAGTRSTLALMYADAGRYDDARAVFDRLAAGDFAELRRNPAWIVAVWCLALPCWISRDADRAASLSRALEPYEDRDIVMGGMVFAFGSTKLPLGLLAAAMGDTDRSVGLLEQALDRLAATGNECMRVLALRELGAVLIGNDDARARECLKGSLDRMEALGLRGLELRARELLAHIEPVAATKQPDALCREGEYWSITFEGSTVMVRDVKGLRDIAFLLATPGRELHVAQLVAVSEGNDAGEVATVVKRPTDELVDGRAREAYRERIIELRQELDDARDACDLGRAERARAELDALSEQLGSAYGLGGRPREMTNDAERARKAVGWRIRDAIKRIDAAHPALGSHLRESLQLGVVCVYRPVAPRSWTIAP